MIKTTYNGSRRKVTARCRIESTLPTNEPIKVKDVRHLIIEISESVK